MKVLVSSTFLMLVYFRMSDAQMCNSTKTCSVALQTCNYIDTTVCTEGGCACPADKPRLLSGACTARKVGDTCDTTKLARGEESWPDPHGRRSGVVSCSSGKIVCATGWVSHAGYCRRSQITATKGPMGTAPHSCSDMSYCQAWYRASSPHGSVRCYSGKCACAVNFKPSGENCIPVGIGEACTGGATTNTPCNVGAECDANGKCNCPTTKEYGSIKQLFNGILVETKGCILKTATKNVARGAACDTSLTSSTAKLCDGSKNLYCGLCSGATARKCLQGPASTGGGGGGSSAAAVKVGSALLSGMLLIALRLK